MRRAFSYALVAVAAFVLGWWTGRQDDPVRTPDRVVPAAISPPSEGVDAEPLSTARSPLPVPTESEHAVEHASAPSTAPIPSADTPRPQKSQKEWRLELLEKDLAVLQRKQALPLSSTRWGNAYLVVMQSIAAIMDAAGTSTDDVPPFSPRSAQERYFNLAGRAYRFRVGEFPEFDAVQDYATRYSEYESARIRDPSAVEPLLSPDVVDLIVSRAEVALALLK
jgi:hypothetical protein